MLLLLSLHTAQHRHAACDEYAHHNQPAGQSLCTMSVLRKCTTQACEGESNALRDECRAISEDLEVLVKENQVVNHQLTTAVTERYAADQRVVLLIYNMHDVSAKHIAFMDGRLTVSLASM